jgi:tRNA G10  N-methylase Trm11
MGSILKEISPGSDEDMIHEALSSDFFNITEKRINFGFSLYSLNTNVPKKLVKSIQKIGLRLKKDFKAKGNSARFVISRDKALSSVVVTENKLIERGADIYLLVAKDKIYLGKTLAVQDYKQFIRRDFKRPDRDAKSGMLPPKLAQIMVNLSQAKPDDVLLDPFCGSGTVLQEAQLLGIQKVIGTDISPKAVQDTKSNLEWLKSNFNLSSFSQIFQSDIKDFLNKFKEKVDVIVTEPFLGPPLKGNESMDQIKSISKELSQLYLGSFQVFTQILKEEGRIVIVFPILKKGNQEIALEIDQEIEKIGFMIKERVQYSRPDQKVLREILVLKNRTEK